MIEDNEAAGTQIEKEDMQPFEVEIPDLIGKAEHESDNHQAENDDPQWSAAEKFLMYWLVDTHECCPPEKIYCRKLLNKNEIIATSVNRHHKKDTDGAQSGPCPYAACGPEMAGGVHASVVYSCVQYGCILRAEFLA
jgi:hypothetical protein